MSNVITEAQIADEIREFNERNGRPPTLREWKVEYKHSDSRCAQYGGYAAVRERALGSDFIAPELPDRDIPIDTLIDERIRRYEQYWKYESARRLVQIKVNVTGPIAIVHFGDPNLDDDGTDLARLKRDLEIVDQTPFMYAANVGDVTNNWVGRLAKQWAMQSTTEFDAWRLAEWMFDACRWLYVVAGNHDLWASNGKILDWVASTASTVHHRTQVRIALQFPNGREVRINARHDFPGSSIWNPAHGPMKAAQMGWRDHVLTCGHKHKSGYGPIKDPMTGMISHAIQVPSYKFLDDYAARKGFPDQMLAPCCTTIIDPDAEEETGLVLVDWDLERAACMLGALRSWRKS